MAGTDKAHKVDGDEGAEACWSTPQTAGTSTLVALQPPLGGWPVSQVPDLVLGPRQPADSGELQQAGRRDTTRSFGMRSKVCVGWAASAVTPGRRSLNGRATDGRRAESG